VKSKKIYFVFFVLVLAALSGCAAGPGATKAADESAVRTRAVERWDLLIAHKAEKAWDYLSPGYRETKPRDIYAAEMNSRGMRWTKATFESQICDGDLCKVHLLIAYNVDLGGPVGRVGSLSPVEESWIKVKGQWYFLPDQLQPSKLGE
jgi:hypothetical protein